ncbi:DnaJ protein, putative [Plasmodium sp. DRC-Itaito]|nr:DnaJ protein, putative [Plasmodium sp. DRC-Itaito]
MSSKQDVDLYEILGVNRRAGIKEITRAYRILALKYHPDKFLTNFKKSGAAKDSQDATNQEQNGVAVSSEGVTGSGNTAETENQNNGNDGNSGNSENAENAEDAGNSENSEDTENSRILEDCATPENTPNSENSVNVSNSEYSENQRVVAEELNDQEKHQEEDSTNCSNDAEEEMTLEKCKEMFLQIQKAYEILKNPILRENYDIFGLDKNLDEFQTYYEPRLFHSRVNVKDIMKYEKVYKGSAEEKEDLMYFYERFHGDLNNILEFIPLSEAKDLNRYIGIFEKALADGEIVKTEVYERSLGNLEKIISKYESLIKKEKSEISKNDNKKKSKKKKEDSLEELILAIRNNEEKRNLKISNLLTNIEMANKKKNKRRKKEDFPSEEELDKIKKKLEENKKRNEQSRGKK